MMRLWCDDVMNLLIALHEVVSWSIEQRSTPEVISCTVWFLIYLFLYILTDLINALPGNSSVNTVQHATIEEAVFSVSAVTSRSGAWWSSDMCFLWCVSVPWLYKWQNSFGSGTSQFLVGDSHGKFVVEEEYMKSTCEDLTCDLKTLSGQENRINGRGDPLRWPREKIGTNFCDKRRSLGQYSSLAD
jgi:hypothetical protein